MSPGAGPGLGRGHQHFNDESHGDALLLGMTATPRGMDGRFALDLFDLVGYETARPEFQDLGYLVPIQYSGVKAALSLDQLKRSGGDFQVGALSAVMDAPQVRALTPRAWEDKAKGTRHSSSARVSGMRTSSLRISPQGAIAPPCSTAVPVTGGRFSSGFGGATSSCCSTTAC